MEHTQASYAETSCEFVPVEVLLSDFQDLEKTDPMG
jgi:hypothetical protein